MKKNKTQRNEVEQRLFYHRQLRDLLSDSSNCRDPAPLLSEYIQVLQAGQSSRDTELAALYNWLHPLLDQSARGRTAPFGDKALFDKLLKSQPGLGALIGEHVQGIVQSGVAASSGGWTEGAGGKLYQVGRELISRNVLWEQALGLLIQRYKAAAVPQAGNVTARWRQDIRSTPYDQLGYYEFDVLVDVAPNGGVDAPDDEKLKVEYVVRLLSLKLDPPKPVKCDKVGAERLVSIKCSDNESLEVNLMMDDNKPFRASVVVDRKLTMGESYPFQVKVNTSNNSPLVITSPFYPQSYSMGLDPCWDIPIRVHYLDQTGPDWTSPLMIRVKRK